ncbi:hypothetical protein ACQKIE_12320 [Luteibacter sp. NPDC031894]|jgi:hypothetical protein|uniref:hypothetical protein n=1 Tax=Luteibacter sp. NPDC031894 TaxID=3390572 RepID=UPI003CFBCBDA
MKLLPSFRRSYRAAAVAALFFAGPALAGNMPDPTHLPRCHSFIEADATCLLPVKSGDFESLAGWETLGRIAIGTEADNSYALLGYGSALQQSVYAMFYKWDGAAYALRFKVRSTSGDAQVHVALSMSDANGQFKKPIGSTTTTVSGGGWQVVELVANGKPFPPPAHVLVEITNVEGPATAIHVDDVYLVEAPADAVEVL